MTRPRVLFVTNFCTHYRVRLFELLHERLGAEFVFFSEGREEYWQPHLGVSQGRFPAVTISGSARTKVGHALNKGLLRELRTRNYDLLICGMDGRVEVPTAYSAARLTKAAFVLWAGMWMHPRSLFHSLSHPLVRQLYRHADAIVTYGQHVSDFLIAEGAKTDRLFVAENATDNNLYGRPVPPLEIRLFRERHDLGTDPVVLAVSRLVDHKGLEYLIEAVGLLPTPRPRLVIVGTGILASELASLADQHGVILRIIGGQRPPDMPCAYAASSLFVMPSVTTRTVKEPWGLACNEAMCQGIPVIATTAVGAAAGGLVVDGRTGLVVPERDAPALAEALKRLLRNSAFATGLSVRGSQRVQLTDYEGMVAGFEAAVEYADRRRVLNS